MLKGEVGARGNNTDGHGPTRTDTDGHRLKWTPTQLFFSPCLASCAARCGDDKDVQ
jgi:hypothetical protein